MYSVLGKQVLRPSKAPPDVVMAIPTTATSRQGRPTREQVLSTATTIMSLPPPRDPWLQQMYDKITVLHKAAAHNRVDLIGMLLWAGANRHDHDNSGATPLHWAAATGSLDAMQILKADNYSKSASDREYGTPVHWAVRCNQLMSIKALLDDGWNVKAYDKQGWTPLHHAVKANNVDIAMELLSRGASVHVRLSGHASAFDLAGDGALKEVMRLSCSSFQ